MGVFTCIDLCGLPHEALEYTGDNIFEVLDYAGSQVQAVIMQSKDYPIIEVEVFDGVQDVTAGYVFVKKIVPDSSVIHCELYTYEDFYLRHEVVSVEKLKI